MTQLIGAWNQGLILALLALGVYISFRVFRFADITVDGSFTLGAAVSATLLTHGWNPLVATLLGMLAGMCAGVTTGVLHTKFKFNPLLAGILVMTALYTVNLRVMGRSNLPLGNETTLSTYAGHVTRFVMGDQERVALWGWEVVPYNLTLLGLSLGTIVLVGVGLFAYFKTDLGTAMRATGDNDQMIRALGVNVDAMIIAGLALSNGLVALAGALLAQYQGLCDLGMGFGMVLTGLASVIIGEALVGGQHHVGLAIVGPVMGMLLFQLVVALVLRAGLNSNDLKLFTALFVFVALILPDLLARVTKRWKGRVQHA